MWFFGKLIFFIAMHIRINEEKSCIQISILRYKNNLFYTFFTTKYLTNFHDVDDFFKFNFKRLQKIL